VGEWPSDGIMRVASPSGSSPDVQPTLVIGGIAVGYSIPSNILPWPNAIVPPAKSVLTTGITAAGNTTVWPTLGSGNYLIVQSFTISVTQNAVKAAAALSILQLTDGAGGATFGGVQIAFPAAGGTAIGAQVYQFTLPAGGQIGSSGTSVVFNMSGGALTAGAISVSVNGWQN
jgi:hypothetical protein